MSTSCSMNQLHEKHVAVEISQCLWSPKMDLLAFANVQGQVALHRLSWQRVWILNSPSDGVLVTALAWRPDSKILAIGYTSGQVSLINIEDSSLIHKLSFEKEVTALHWEKHDSGSQNTQGKSSFGLYTIPLPPLGKSFGENPKNSSTTFDEPELLYGQTSLSLLLVGTVEPYIHWFAFGLFHVASLELSYLNRAYYNRVVDIAGASDLSSFSVVLESTPKRETSTCNNYFTNNEFDSKTTLHHILIKSPLLEERNCELHCLASKCGQIQTLLKYSTEALSMLEEAFETVLLEMDSKLTSYAKQSSSVGGVSADFLDLLVFGHTTQDFEFFLTGKLTEKGLKKLRVAVQASYSTIEKLLVRNIEVVALSLVQVIAEIGGMAKIDVLYGDLGVQEKAVSDALQKAGAFLLKAGEMVGVIESSQQDFLIFLRWISSCLLRLLHEAVPVDLTRFSPLEIKNLTRFLQECFDDTGSENEGEGFKLERLGQYLVDNDLKIPIETESPWEEFLTRHPEVLAHPLVFKRNSSHSLIQEHKSLTNSLLLMGAEPAKVISTSLSIETKIILKCNFNPQLNSRVSQTCNPVTHTILTSFVPSIGQHDIIVSQWPTQIISDCTKLQIRRFFISSDYHTPLNVLDARFYSASSLCILLQDPIDPIKSYVAMVRMDVLFHNVHYLDLPESCCMEDLLNESIDATRIGECVSMRRMESGRAICHSVSAPRKVASVLLEGHRKIRIYEMEVEDDDEDDTRDETS